MKKIFLLLSVSFLFSYFIQAQVTYKLTVDATGTYTVSFNSAASYGTAQNKSRVNQGSQVTIVVPAGFNLTNLTQLAGGASKMQWDTSRASTPTENPTKDYFFFDLSNGASYTTFAITAGTDYPLFSFKSGAGCVGELHLINNSTDPFLPPNSQNLNTGNSFTIFGFGGDAYSSNAAASAVCVSPPTLTVTYPTLTAGTAAPLTFTTTNSSGNPAQSGLGFTYTLPAGVTFAGTPNITNSCGGTPVINGTTITFTGGSLASGTASCVVTANIVAAAAGTITPTAANVTSTTGVTNGTPATQTITVGAAACAANAGTLGY